VAAPGASSSAPMTSLTRMRANNWAVREGGMAAYRASGGAGASPDDLDGHRDLPFKTALSHVLCGRGAPPYSQRPRC